MQITEHQMLAILLVRWKVPFVGLSVPVAYAPDCNAKWPEGAANE